MIKRKTLSQKIEEQHIVSNNAQSLLEGCTIMGIDPGTNILGYALMRVEKGEPQIITLGVLNLSKFSDHYQKLGYIFDRLSSLIKEYRPSDMALEAPFYGTNVQSMLKLGRAQGVAMSAALNQKVDVFEYMPTKVKQSVTGNGRASKEQVAGILKHLLGIDPLEHKLDATDALAVAMCHYINKSSHYIVM